MAINKINLSKLKRCNQYWEEMTPIEGGRLCEKCERCIVDFRNKTPLEIAIMHAYKEGALCGIYSEEQLSDRKSRHSKPRFAYAKSLLVSMGLLTSTANVSAQTTDNKPSIEVMEADEENTSKSESEEETEEAPMEVEKDSTSFLIGGKVIEAGSAEELIGATLWIRGTTVGVVSDMEGGFQLDLTDKIAEIDKEAQVMLVCQYIGFETQEIPLDFEKENHQNMVIKMVEGAEITDFVVRHHYPLHRKIWRTVTFPFRAIGRLVSKPFRKKYE